MRQHVFHGVSSNKLRGYPDRTNGAGIFAAPSASPAHGPQITQTSQIAKSTNSIMLVHVGQDQGL